MTEEFSIAVEESTLTLDDEVSSVLTVITFADSVLTALGASIKGTLFDRMGMSLAEEVSSQTASIRRLMYLSAGGQDTATVEVNTGTPGQIEIGIASG